MPRIMRNHAARPGGATFWRFALALLLPFVLACPSGSLAAKRSAASVDATVQRLKGMLNDGSATKTMLKDVESDLEAACTAHPKGDPGAKAAFYLARTHEEIAGRTGADSDWKDAADAFDAFTNRFPRHLRVTEALYRRGRILLNRLDDADGAARTLRTLVAKYPTSVYSARARKLLAQAGRPDARQGKRAAAGAKRQATPSDPQNDDRPTLFALRLRNHAKRARVIFDLDGPTRYKYQQLGDGRLYIDLLGADVGDDVPAQKTISGGMLKRVRVAERPASGFVRVVLDFTKLGDCSVQVLRTPFRIVLDARTTPGGKNAKPPATQPDRDADAAAPPPPRPGKLAALAPSGSRGKIAANLVEQLGLSVRTIMIDPGHGGKDPGAQAFGNDEKDINLRLARILGGELKRRGFRVLYTRTGDVFIPLQERTAMANSKKADLFISLHCNAYKSSAMHGLETYSLNLAKTPDEVRVAARENAVSAKNISDLQMILTDLMLTSKIKESVELARDVQKDALSSVRKRWSLSDNGNRGAPFYVLMGARMPAVLIEIGYITNRSELSRLQDPAYLKAVAQGVADGVSAYKKAIERFARSGASHSKHRKAHRRTKR